MSDHPSATLATTTVTHATGGLVIRTMDDLARIGKMLAQSGYFADAREAAQAGVKVLAGLELGIGAFSSMSGIHVIDGKPSIGAGLMAAAVKRSGKYDYRVRKHTATECEIEFFENSEACGVSTFTIEDAKQAGVAFKSRSGNPTPWAKNPRNMLFARALSNGVRWYAPDVFNTSTYTPDELGAETDEHGDVITVTTVERPVRVTPEPVERSAEEVQPPLEPEDGEFPPDPPDGTLDSDAKPVTISASAANRLHAKLGKVGVPKNQHYDVATAATGRYVTAFTGLTKLEAVRVSEVADALNDGRALFRDGAIISTEPPDDEIEQAREGDAA